MLYFSHAVYVVTTFLYGWWRATHYKNKFNAIRWLPAPSQLPEIPADFCINTNHAESILKESFAPLASKTKEKIIEYVFPSNETTVESPTPIYQVSETILWTGIIIFALLAVVVVFLAIRNIMMPSQKTTDQTAPTCENCISLLASIDQQAEANRVQIDSYVSQLQQKDQDHTSALADKDKQRADELDALKSEHQTTLATFDADYDDLCTELRMKDYEHECALADKERQHQNKLVAQTVQNQITIIEILKGHQKALKSLSDENDETRIDEIESLKSEQQQTLKQAKDDYEQKLAELKDDHQKKLGEVRDEHQNARDQMQSDHETALNATKDSLTTMTRQRDILQARVNSIQPSTFTNDTVPKAQYDQLKADYFRESAKKEEKADEKQRTLANRNAVLRRQSAAMSRDIARLTDDNSHLQAENGRLQQELGTRLASPRQSVSAQPEAVVDTAEPATAEPVPQDTSSLDKGEITIPAATTVDSTVASPSNQNTVTENDVALDSSASHAISASHDHQDASSDIANTNDDRQDLVCSTSLDIWNDNNGRPVDQQISEEPGDAACLSEPRPTEFISTESSSPAATKPATVLSSVSHVTSTATCDESPSGITGTENSEDAENNANRNLIGDANPTQPSPGHGVFMPGERPYHSSNYKKRVLHLPQYQFLKDEYENVIPRLLEDADVPRTHSEKRSLNCGYQWNRTLMFKYNDSRKAKDQEFGGPTVLMQWDNRADADGTEHCYVIFVLKKDPHDERRLSYEEFWQERLSRFSPPPNAPTGPAADRGSSQTSGTNRRVFRGWTQNNTSPITASIPNSRFAPAHIPNLRSDNSSKFTAGSSGNVATANVTSNVNVSLLQPRSSNPFVSPSSTTPPPLLLVSSHLASNPGRTAVMASKYADPNYEPKNINASSSVPASIQPTLTWGPSWSQEGRYAHQGNREAQTQRKPRTSIGGNKHGYQHPPRAPRYH